MWGWAVWGLGRVGWLMVVVVVITMRQARRREAAQQVLSKTQRNLQDFYAKVRGKVD